MAADFPQAFVRSRGVAAVAGLVALCGSLDPAHGVTFAPPITGAVGNEARWVVSGDLNEDGRPDLLVTSRYESYVSVLLAQPNGTLGERSLYNFGSASGFLAIADVDLDGHLDAVVGPAAPTAVAVMRGDGLGALTIASTPTAGLYPVSIAIGDLNDDGWPDLVTANPGTIRCCHSVTTLVGTGSGSFAAPNTLYVTHEVSTLALGDFDGDGALDVVATATPGGLGFYRGNGDGTIREPVSIFTSNLLYDIDVADLNEDGHQDLVISGWPSSALFFAGNGDGTFAPQLPLAAGKSYGVAVADFDGDGHLDVATSVADSVAIVVGNGDGTFDAPVLVPCGGLLMNLETADMNADGRPDLVVLHGSTVAVLLNTTAPLSIGEPVRTGSSLEGLRPNPATGELRAAFTLARVGAGSLEMIDIGGRRVMAREFMGLPPGPHLLTLGHAGQLSPGVYWLRLRQGTETHVIRAVVFR